MDPKNKSNKTNFIVLSNAAPYLMKAGRAKKIMYSKTEHISCLVHGLHSIAEEIQKTF